MASAAGEAMATVARPASATAVNFITNIDLCKEAVRDTRMKSD